MSSGGRDGVAERDCIQRSLRLAMTRGNQTPEARDQSTPDGPGHPPDPGHALERIVETVLPTAHGQFRIIGYRGGDGEEHVAMLRGLQDGGSEGIVPLVRVHCECLTGDVFGSYRCDCGEQLDAALAAVAAYGHGAVIYVRGHEGRGIGLVEKLRAYRLQDHGADTLDANLALDHAVDLRTYEQSAAILRDLGATSIRLMSSNPAKETALSALGIDVVDREPLFVASRPENARYLATKRERLGHDRPPEDEPWGALLAGRIPLLAGGREGTELVERYGPLVAAGTPLTIAQLGQSLDGFIASRTGDARFVTGEKDRKHLHRLRALVDAVLVGAGTICKDNPQLTVRAVRGDNPVRVLLDPSARIPLSSAVLTDGGPRTLWLVGPAAQVPRSLAEHVEVVRLERDGDNDPGSVLHVLRERGLGRVLVEGGGRTVSGFLAARRLDRLYLTIAPLLIGDGVPGVRFDGCDALAGARRGESRRFVLGEDVCIELVLPFD